MIATAAATSISTTTTVMRVPHRSNAPVRRRQRDARRRVHSMTSTSTTPMRARVVRTAPARSAGVVVRASGDEAENSARYRRAADDDEEVGGLIGKLVSSLPDGRKESAPESYGARPESRTLKEGRYARGDPIRSGLVREDTIRGEDFEVVEGGAPSVGTLATLAVGAGVLFGVYKVVDLIGQAPAETPRRSSARMPASDRDIATKASVEAPAVSIE